MRRGAFIPEKLEENNKQLNNPFRGWYRIVYYMAKDKPEIKISEYNYNRKYMLELVIINISSFKETPISNDALNNIRTILDNYRNKAIAVILRIVYDHEGKAMEREPFFFNLVCEHMGQLGKLIKEYADIILVYQGLLIGNWGEMHSSRFLQTDKMKMLLDIFMKSTDNLIPLAVRKPSQLRSLSNKNNIYKRKLSLFDDAIMGSENHLGTFGLLNKDEAGWESEWNINEELIFEREIAKYNPIGGELIAPANLDKISSANIIKRLSNMGITYLNADYDKKILDKIDKPDYLSNHLGYRYYIEAVFVKSDWKKSWKKFLHIKFVNSGFAGIYRKASVYLEWADVDNKLNKSCIIENLMEKNGLSNWEEIIPLEIFDKKVKSALYLFIWLEAEDRIIYLANDSEKDGLVRLGTFI